MPIVASPQHDSTFITLRDECGSDGNSLENAANLIASVPFIEDDATIQVSDGSAGEGPLENAAILVASAPYIKDPSQDMAASDGTKQVSDGSSGEGSLENATIHIAYAPSIKDQDMAASDGTIQVSDGSATSVNAHERESSSMVPRVVPEDPFIPFKIIHDLRVEYMNLKDDACNVETLQYMYDCCGPKPQHRLNLILTMRVS